MQARVLWDKPPLGGNIGESEVSHCLLRDGPFLIAMHQAMRDGSWRTSNWFQQDLLGKWARAGKKSALLTVLNQDILYLF